MDYKTQFAESLSDIFTNELTQNQILDLMKHRNKMNSEMQHFHVFHLRSNIKNHQLLSQKKLRRN